MQRGKQSATLPHQVFVQGSTFPCARIKYGTQIAICDVSGGCKTYSDPSKAVKDRPEFVNKLK